MYTNNKCELEAKTLKDKKIRSDINRSSNVKQDVNVMTKTLQETHIINDNYKNYKQTRKNTLQMLINNNEWTPCDLRKKQHINYKLRSDFIKRYLQRKNIKQLNYITMNKLTLNDKKWWDINEINEINQYITYQKTLCVKKKINKPLRKCINIIPDEMKKNNKIIFITNTNHR